MAQTINVLFVCMGNICRSPTAEGVFRRAVEQSALSARIRIDSCGTGNWHVGKAPDSRAAAAARARGIDISHLRARQFTASDLDEFDYVLVMDRQNLDDIKAIWRRHGGTEPELFLSYATQTNVDEVPDPYYGGDHGFEQVLDLIAQASQGLLDGIRDKHS